jgi:hypothetical protein
MHARHPSPHPCHFLSLLQVGDVSSGKSSLIRTLLEPLSIAAYEMRMPTTGLLGFSSLDIREYSARAARWAAVQAWKRALAPTQGSSGSCGGLRPLASQQNSLVGCQLKAP